MLFPPLTNIISNIVENLVKNYCHFVQVSPTELENIIKDHQDVAVVGIPSDQMGKAPRSYVVPRLGAAIVPSPKVLKLFLRVYPSELCQPLSAVAMHPKSQRVIDEYRER